MKPHSVGKQDVMSKLSNASWVDFQIKQTIVSVMFVGSQKSELRTHKMAGQQQDCIDESTWFYMKPLYITRAQFIQNIMTSQYYNTSPWRFVKNTCNSLISENKTNNQC